MDVKQEYMIGKRIKSSRKAIGMTQEQLGEKIGVTGVTIMRYERGYRCPDIPTIRKLAKELDVSDSFLLGVDNTLEAIRSGELNETPVIKDLEQISEIFERLNKVGRQKTIDFALDLLEIPRYEKPSWRDRKAKWIAIENRTEYESLNDAGQEKAVERVEELTEIPKYQRDPDNE